jgi:hypothetical protein
MRPDATHKGRMLVLAGCGAAALAVAGALRTDDLVSRGFGRALDSVPGGLSLQAGKAQADAAAVGDEGYWLTRSEVEGPTLLGKPVAIGDRITITGRDGRERKLEVVHLKAIGEPISKVGNGAAPLRLLLVTCRIVEGTEAESRTPVRFIVEGELAEPAVPAPAKAL